MAQAAYSALTTALSATQRSSSTVYIKSLLGASVNENDYHLA